MIAKPLCYMCYWAEKKKRGFLCHKQGIIISSIEAPRKVFDCKYFEPVWNHRTFRYIELNRLVIVKCK